jgi:beta-galactosidase GanA
MLVSTSEILHLRKTNIGQQLIVNGRPFLSVAGELPNSSLNSAEYMNTAWQKPVDTNANTVLGCVTWQYIEPVEGQFSFTELDKIILEPEKMACIL